MSTGTEQEDGDMDDDRDREGENDPDSIEQYVWNLMGKTGLLSELKSRIALFVQENGRLLPGVSVIPSRADPIILNQIFEYLQWVGMKNTASLFLSESPFNIETKSLGDSEEPALCGLFEKANKSTRLSSGLNQSHTTTPSATPVVNKTFTSKFMGTPLSPTGKDGSFFTPLSPKRDLLKGIEFGESLDEDDFLRNDEVNINSMQSMQSEPVDSPLQTPGGNSDSIPTTPAATSTPDNIDNENENENEKNTSKSEEQEASEMSQAENEINASKSDVVEALEKSQAENEKNTSKSDEVEASEKSENEKNASKVAEASEVLEKSQPSEENDDSISDLLDSVQLDDNTQDISIDSDSRGMSSCEHVVNLK